MIGSDVYIHAADSDTQTAAHLRQAIKWERDDHPGATVVVVMHPEDATALTVVDDTEIRRMRPPYGPEIGTAWVLTTDDLNLGLAVMAG